MVSERAEMSGYSIDAYKQIADLVKTMSERINEYSGSAVEELVRHAVEHIACVDYAGITVVARRQEVITPVASHEVPRTLDAIQHRHHEGPCLDAALNQDTYYLANLSADERWPIFRREASAQTSVQSIVSYQLFTTRDAVGALNLYSERADAFDEASRDLGYVFAAHAAVLWNAMRRGEQFRSALASRDTIGQAKGMLMERYNIGPHQAFELLRKLSQDANIRLADIAHSLVEADHPHDT